MGHFYPRQTILAPVGLVTQPNEYGQYPPGALRTARNVLMRAPGKLVQAPDIRNTVSLGPPGGQIHKLMPADSGIVYSVINTAGTWSIFADAASQTFVGSATNTFSATGRISWAQCKDRVIVNALNGCLVRDPVPPPTTNFRHPGLPQPSVSDVQLSGSAGWLLPNQAVSYRVCLVRHHSDGYTLRSTPSVVFRRNGQAGPFNPVVSVNWPSAGGVEPGDVIELYRTDILSTTSLYADTGATFKLAQEHTLTAADIAGPPPLNLTDPQPPILGTLKTQGRELYTNPGVEGENYANLRPPVAACLASFKGFCFYGNTTERAQLKFGVPGGWGRIEFAPDAGVAAATAREKGIGLRTGTGTTVIGSPNVTAVSAADMVGIAVGQRWRGGLSFGLNATVIARTATSFTMSANATVVDTHWELADVIEIDGSLYSMERPAALFQDLAGAMEAEFDQAVAAIQVYYASFELTLMWNFYFFATAISVRATNGQNYSPALPLMGTLAAAKVFAPLVTKNRLCWSKEQQPEHAPSVSETFIGFGEMYAINPTRDALWIWCSDGLFRLAGNGGAQGLGAWQVDYANSTLLLSAPQASTVLEERLYGYCNAGVVELDSAGNLRNLTDGIIGNLLPGPRYQERLGLILERNETDGEILLAPGDVSDPPPFDSGNGLSNHIFIYNVKQRGWTQLDDNHSGLGWITAMAMFRLPPAGAEAHVLIAPWFTPDPPRYSSWNSDSLFLPVTVAYQPVYGDDPLELKRWMWVDYLFDATSTGALRPLWNDTPAISSIDMQKLDMSVYARAGCPREVGLSHSISVGFGFDDASVTQRRFEGLSLAIKQRTNQSKQR